MGPDQVRGFLPGPLTFGVDRSSQQDPQIHRAYTEPQALGLADASHQLKEEQNNSDYLFRTEYVPGILGILLISFNLPSNPIKDYSHPTEEKAHLAQVHVEKGAFKHGPGQPSSKAQALSYPMSL